MKKLILASIALASFTVINLSAQTLAFPGAVGFGQNATGGRGGTIVYVTNTNDSGAGSFRDAVGTANRIVLFSVGGTITLGSAVSCADNLTIAGQTAPGGGIAIIGHEISFSKKSNEIVRHLRIRPGSLASSTEDGINMGDGTNMIFDHVSLEFAPYNTIDATGSATGANQITLQNCILADPIGQQFNAHCQAINNNICWWNNIFSSGHDRNPMAKMNTIFINNIVYNYQAGYTCADTSGKFKHDIVNDFFISGPATTSPNNCFFQFDSNQSVYCTHTLLDSDRNGSLGSGSAVTPGGGSAVLTSPWSTLTPSIPTLSSASAVRQDISLSGAQPRDQVDTLVQADLLSFGSTGAGTGLWRTQTSTGLGNNGYGVIDGGPAPALDTDGLPKYWEVAMGLDPNANNANTIAPSGYTYVEEYINWLAAPHALTTDGTPVEVNLSQYTDGFVDSPTYAVSSAIDGSVSLNGDMATFTANSGFSGMASFNFKVTDTEGDAMTQTVIVLVSPGTTAGPLADGIYEILNVHSGLALDAFGQGTTNGTEVDQWIWTSGKNQQWAVTNIGSSTYTIVGVQSGLNLHASASSEGTYVELYARNGASSQEWLITPVSGGDYTVQGVQSGYLLDDFQNGTTNGSRVDIWPVNGNNNQQWSFTPR
jgi:hypothetical protein